MTNGIRAALSAAVVITGLLAASACGASSPGYIHPHGVAYGNFPYCAYKPDGSGIEVPRTQTTPCVVIDARSKKDRKPKQSHRTTAPATGHSYVGSLPKTKTTSKSSTSKSFNSSGSKSKAPSFKKR